MESSAANAATRPSTPTRSSPRRADRREPDERRLQRRGQRETQRAAGGAEDEALGEELLDQASAARAERSPNGHLAGALERAGQRQVRDVRARDQQHEPDRAREHEERRGHARRSARGTAARPPSGLRGSSSGTPRPGLADAVEVRARRLERRARRQPSDGLQVLAVVAGVGQAPVVADGRPQLGRRVVARRDELSKSRGMTPTTRKSMSFSRTRGRRPTGRRRSSGARGRRRGGRRARCPGRSSSGRKSRPSAGETPSIGEEARGHPHRGDPLGLTVRRKRRVPERARRPWTRSCGSRSRRSS